MAFKLASDYCKDARIKTNSFQLREHLSQGKPCEERSSSHYYFAKRYLSGAFLWRVPLYELYDGLDEEKRRTHWLYQQLPIIGRSKHLQAVKDRPLRYHVSRQE